MNNDSIQSLILEQLKILNIQEFEEINIDKILFNVSGVSINARIKFMLQDVAKRLICNSFIYDINQNESKLLFLTYDYHRVDHMDSWRKFKALFNDYDEIIMDDLGFSKKRILKPKQIISSITKLFEFYSQLYNINSRRTRVILAAHLVELHRLKLLLDGYSFDYNVVVTFFDGGSYENLVIQYLKMRGITTVTMQHGQPVFHGFGIDRINQTMILNFSSDYVIVPGVYGKEQFMLGGVDAKNIAVLGSLRNISEPQMKLTNEFLVFLDCPTNNSAKLTNSKLVLIAEKIAEERNMTYRVKLHPQDSLDNYSDTILNKGWYISGNANIANLVVNASFAILHISGIYLDLLAAGIKSFCYQRKNEIGIVTSNLDKFETEDDLNDKLYKWLKMTDQEQIKHINEEVERYLSPINAKERHQTFIYNLEKV